MLSFSLVPSHLGGTGLGIDTGKLAPEPGAAPAIRPGTCTDDGALIWRIAADGTGYWARRSASEQCLILSSVHHEDPRTSGGGTSITETASLRTFEAKELEIRIRRTMRDIQENVSLAPSLPACPASTQDGPNGVCFYKSPVVSLAAQVLPPGSFEFYGVVFHASELKEGRFDRAFTPDAEQRFLIDFAIIRRSQELMAGIAEYPVSVNAALARWADLRTNLPGFSLNPIPPTEAELTNEGGYNAWRARGGFPLSWNAAHGRTPIVERASIHTCASVSCACPVTGKDGKDFGANWRDAGLIAPDQTVSLIPRCIGALIGPNGIETKPTEVANNWNVYVAIDDAGSGALQLAIIHNDPAWTQKFGAYFAEKLKALANMFCANPAPIKDQLTKTVAEKCIDKNQKPCTKGTPGCTCTKPPTSAQVGVNAFNMWASHWCGEWTAEYTPTVYEDPTPKIPEELKPRSRWPLFVAAGVAALGAVVVVKTMRQRQLRA